MKNFVLGITWFFAVLNVLSGIFIVQLLEALNVQIPNVQELRWTLIIGMPILLFVSYVWLVISASESIFNRCLQSAGMMAVFLVPYYWIFLHHV